MSGRPPAIAATAGSPERRDGRSPEIEPVQARRDDPKASADEAALLSVVRDHCRDETVMRRLLSRPRLSETVVLELAQRLPARLFGLLTRSQGLVPDRAAELEKRSRTRPEWWQRHLTGYFR